MIGMPHQSLALLARVGGMDLVEAVVKAFTRTSPERLADARRALEAGDARGVAAAAHALKSSCLQLGAAALGGDCEAVEAAAHGGRLDGLAATLDRMADDLAAFRVDLEEAARRMATAPRRIIAVVEDNPDNRLLLRALLASRYDLIECETGEEAVEALTRRVPGVILMDISLPGGDGVETLSRLRRDPALAAVPAVAVTAHAMAGDRERYLAAGFDDYISKPIVDETALLHLVDRLAGDPA